PAGAGEDVTGNGKRETGSGKGARLVLSDPIVALATPPGRSALALIRLSGKGAFEVAARVLHPFRPDPPRAVRRVRVVHPASGEVVDDALVACFPAPRSYTGDDLVELSTHGGLLVPAAALAALVADEIEFPEEDEGPVAPERIERAWSAARRRITQLIATAPEGERLREGALLVIAGRPNAGKSSLFNALLGRERAIVTEVPGTTRDAIEAYAVIAGFPFRLVDTAGLRAIVDRVDKIGIVVA